MLNLLRSTLGSWIEASAAAQPISMIYASIDVYTYTRFFFVVAAQENEIST